MFQHYQSVFQLSPPRAHSCSLYLTHGTMSFSGSVYLSPSLSLFRLLRSLALTSTVQPVCMGRVSLFTPFACAGMGSVRCFVHKQNFLLPEGFLDLFYLDSERSFFFGDLLCLRRWVFVTTSFNFQVFVAVFDACKRYHKNGCACFWMYINSVTLTHTFRIARITIRKILFSVLRTNIKLRHKNLLWLPLTPALYTGSTG